MESLITG